MESIVILGGGESGVGSAVLAKIKGYSVFLSDKGNITNSYKEILEKYQIDYEENQHTFDKILSANLVIKSPGIPDKIPIIQAIVEKGIEIISEIEFAGRYDRAKKICITGSNGKTTTTSLIHYMLKNAGLNVGLAGNIGDSYAFQVATCDYDYYVLELSSFQLDGIKSFKPDIAVLTNITPDHLDRYDYNLQNYINSKFRITKNMSAQDCFIYCADDNITIEEIRKIVFKAKMLPFSEDKEVKEGAFIKDDMIYIKLNDDDYTMYIKELALAGKHNLYNSMAAAITAKAMKIDKEIIRESLMNFTGVVHRMERVLKIRNVLYINDSKATNVNSSWYALDSMTTPVVWIAGGTDKGNDYTPLFELVKDKVKAIICLGVDNNKLYENFSDKVEIMLEASSADEAVQKAYEIAEPGDTVLLSPSCASFDLFKNYEDRGDQFKRAVRNL